LHCPSHLLSSKKEFFNYVESDSVLQQGIFSHFYKTIQLLWARKFNKESSEKIFHALLIEISGLFQKSHKRTLTIDSKMINFG